MSDNQQQIGGMFVHASGGFGVGGNNCAPKPACDPCRKPKFQVPSSKRCGAKKVNPCDMVYQPQCPPQNVCDSIGAPMMDNNNNNFIAQDPPFQQFGQYPYQQFPQQTPQGFQQPPQGFQQPPQGFQATPQGKFEDAKLSLTHEDNRNVLVVYFSFDGSLNAFYMDSQATMKSIKDIESIGDLPDKSLLLDVRVLSGKNTTLTDIGIVFDGGATEGNINTPAGPVHYVLHAGATSQHIQGVDGKGFRIHRPTTDEIGVIMENYGHMDPKSIEMGITDVQDLNGETSHCTVHKDHIVPKILQMNRQTLELGNEVFKPIGEYFNIAKPLVDTCVKQLRENVFDKIGNSLFNLGNAQLKIVRADGREWNDITGLAGVTNGIKDYALNEPQSVSLVLEFTFAARD